MSAMRSASGYAYIQDWRALVFFADCPCQDRWVNIRKQAAREGVKLPPPVQRAHHRPSASSATGQQTPAQLQKWSRASNGTERDAQPRSSRPEEHEGDDSSDRPLKRRKAIMPPLSPMAASNSEDSNSSSEEPRTAAVAGEDAGMHAERRDESTSSASESSSNDEAVDAEARGQEGLESKEAADIATEDIAEEQQAPQLAFDADDPLRSTCNLLKESWLVPSISATLLKLADSGSPSPNLCGKKLQVAAIMALAQRRSYVLVDVNKGRRDATMLSWWKCFAAWIGIYEEGHFKDDYAEQFASKLLLECGRHVFGKVAVKALKEGGQKPSKGMSA